MTACPHGANSDPARCSQCIGVRARVVRSDAQGVTVDGVKVRGGIETWLADGQARDGQGKRRRVERARKAARHHAPASAAQPDPVLEDDLHVAEPEPEPEPEPEAEESAPDLDVAPAAVAAPSPDPSPEPVAPEPSPVRQPGTRKPPKPARRADSPVVTARQLAAAQTIIDYGETHAALAFPTPAGCEAVALLDCALDMAGSDEEIAALHRLGLIQLVALGDQPGLDRSLRLRGHRRDNDSIVLVDGVAHDGVKVIASQALIGDALEYAELVWMHHEKQPTAAFVRRAEKLARGDDPKLAAGARAFICSEWDRIRGVLPALSPEDISPEPVEHEAIRVAPLLKQLCAAIDQPQQAGPGRPRLPLGDVVFAVVMMAGMQATGRAAARELAALQGRGLIDRTVSAPSLWRAMQSPDVGRALARLVEESGSMAGPRAASILPAASSRTKLPQTHATEQLALAVCRNLMHVAQEPTP